MLIKPKFYEYKLENVVHSFIDICMLYMAKYFSILLYKMYRKTNIVFLYGLGRRTFPPQNAQTSRTVQNCKYLGKPEKKTFLS